MLGIDSWQRPLVCAPMAYVGHAPLANAVASTGALGFMGFGSADSPQFITDQCQAMAPGVPWGAALMGWALDSDERPLHAVLEARPPAVCISFGDISPWVGPVKDSGAVLFTQVGTVSEAIAAERAGVDAIVVRGAEAGGHGRNEVGLLPLLSETLTKVKIPVLAAGGIGHARAVSAVLRLGAIAAWVGTRFISAEESGSTPAARAALAQASADDTLYTNAYDRAKKLAWPPEFGGRCLRTEFTEKWHHRQDELADLAQPMDITPIYAGQGVGFCGPSIPAADIVNELLSDDAAATS